MEYWILIKECIFRNAGYGSRIEVSTVKVPSSGFLLGFFLIFGVCYSTNMILSEQSGDNKINIKGLLLFEERLKGTILSFQFRYLNLFIFK